MGMTTAPTPDQPGRWIVSEFGPPSVLKWQRWDSLPTPSKDEVLVSILAAGASGADNIQRAGGYPDKRCDKPGFTPGYDWVGEIVALGPQVPAGLAFSIGDRVASMSMVGGYATHIVLPVGELLRLDKTDDPVAMCALPLNYMTAYGLLTQAVASLPAGSSILIGSVSGGVGTAMAQLVAAFDMAITMYGTCSAAKFDFVKSLGVTPIDRRDPDVAGRLGELSGGKMVDVAYDSVGSKESLDVAAAATKDTGRVVCIGAMSAIKPDGSGMLSDAQQSVDRLESYLQTSVRGGSFFSVNFHYYYIKKDQFAKDFEAIAAKVRAGRLQPAIGKLFPLHQAVQLNEMLVSGHAVQGKMELLVDAHLARAHNL